ncbi:MAG: glycosyltransferase family 39 protein [Deltaproteobacteria bacterium]|nr:glycosyltransferase family 39 protein [Deltaproteobacteria bacterium]MBW2448006.1 glycosyltransferase family 39 protein [Deltaproteobacteria bacterium]
MTSETPSPDAGRRNRAWLALGLVIFGFAFLGSRGLLEPDEGRYTNVAAQMLRSGDYLVPALNEDTPHYTKPPLTYWAIAGSTKLLGHTPWAARLPNGLAWLATVLIVAALARRLGAASPATAGGVYATLLLPYLGASIVTTDTLLAAFEALAVLGVVALWRTPSWGARLTLGAGLGLAFLTKGPVGLLPLLPAALAFAWLGEARQIRRWLHPGVLLPFLAIGGSWFAWLAAAQPDVLEALLRNEIYGRVVEGRFDRHPEWFGTLRIYGPAFLFGTLPWSPLVLAQPRALLAPFRGAFWRELRERDADGLFLWLWLLVPLLILALVRSRLPLYLLPSFVPAALLLARRIEASTLLREPARALLATWVVVLIAARAIAAALPLEASSHVLEFGFREHLGFKPERVVFVDETPSWGIGYTFQAVVEGATLFDTEDPYPPIEDILPKPASKRIFVVARGSERRFRRRAAVAGFGVRRLGSWDHSVYLEASRDIPTEWGPSVP